MIEIEHYLFSDQIFEKEFICDLQNCKGACCIEGDAGAPVTQEEIVQIRESFPLIKQYLSEESLQEIEEQGLYVVDDEFDEVTPTINDGLCVYAYKEKGGVYKCAFEKAKAEGLIEFLKPVSCHLFPIRKQEASNGYILSNYEYRSTCDSACSLGIKEKMPLFQFLRTAIERFYGPHIYQQMEEVYQNYFNKSS